MSTYDEIGRYTIIGSPLRPPEAPALISVAWANHLRGGYHIVSTIEERDAIAAYEERFDRRPGPDSNIRQEGMLCYVSQEKTTFRLEGGVTNDHWEEVDLKTLTSKGWIFPPVNEIVDTLPLNPENGYRVILTTDNNIHEYNINAWVTDPQTDELKEGLAVVVLDVKAIALYIAGSWYIDAPHDRLHDIDNSLDHKTPEDTSKWGSLVWSNEDNGQIEFTKIVNGGIFQP